MNSNDIDPTIPRDQKMAQFFDTAANSVLRKDIGALSNRRPIVRFVVYKTDYPKCIYICRDEQQAWDFAILNDPDTDFMFVCGDPFMEDNGIAKTKKAQEVYTYGWRVNHPYDVEVECVAQQCSDDEDDYSHYD